MGFCRMESSFRDSYQNQSTRLNSATRLNSFVLWVTRVAFELSTIPAMRVSLRPIGEPIFSSSALTPPISLAVQRREQYANQNDYSLDKALKL